MLELVIAGVIGFAGHKTTRDWVRRRLRYTDIIEKPGIGIFSGAAATVVAAPLVGVLPVVGAVTAIAAGVGVGTGVAAGARRARLGWHPEDE